MIASLLFTLIAIAFVAVLITAALSPIETLSWWAGWTEKEVDHPNDTDAVISRKDSSARKHYIVYLSGIASISGRYLLPREKTFLKALSVRIPDSVIVTDVFPYSPSGLPLLAPPRFFDGLWRWIQMLKLEGRSTLLSILINMRNLYQVMISADHRYGPIFNQGVAAVIETALLHAGYHRGDGHPITIIGSSGGGQIAVGAAAFLGARLKAPIDVISIGGVMASDPGLHILRRLDHIYGNRDNVQKLAAIMFPERWKAMAHSEWNMAKREGRVVLHKMPDFTHSGTRGYFGLVPVGGVSNCERTLDEVVSILSAQMPAPAAAP